MTNYSAEHMLNEVIKANVQLQHKVVDLTVSVKDMTKEIKDLVAMFKQAGEHIKKGKYEDPMVAKLNDLIDQNRRLAQGLLLLENYVKEKQVPKKTSFPGPFERKEGF